MVELSGRRHDVLPEPLLVPEQVVEPVAESQGDTTDVQQEQDTDSSPSVPNHKSVLCLNVVIRCTKDTLLRDSCDSHLLFPLRGEECDDCACFIM